MKIELYDLIQTILIVQEKTGIVYTNQVGGTRCFHPEIEGYIVPVEYDIPIDEPKNSLTYKLCQMFPEGNPGSIGEAEALKIQEHLSASPFTSDIEVDWSKLNESLESWVYVNVSGELAAKINRSTNNKVILTWPNSD